MPATIAEIVSDAQGIIGEVAGVGVQQYGEDRLFEDVVRGFNMLFKKYPWHQYRKWFRVELDGALGIPDTDTFDQVRDFEDFVAVYRDAIETPLPILPLGTNPYTLGDGTVPLFWTGLHHTDANYTGRRLQVYPVTSEGFINVLAKLYPLVPPATGFDWQDTLYLDKDLLAYAAAYMTLIGDALNAEAANTVKQFMDARYNDITNALSDHRIPLKGRRGLPTEWFVR